MTKKRSFPKALLLIYLIISQIALTGAGITTLIMSKVYFYAVCIKPAAYVTGAITDAEGRIMPEINVPFVMKQFYRYEYFNYIILLGFVLICFLRFAVVVRRSKSTAVRNSYIVCSCICSSFVALANIIL